MRLDRRSFRKWLRARLQKPGYVGLPRHAASCPVARWLREVGGFRDVIVHTELVSARPKAYSQAGKIYRKPPPWLATFVTLTDDLPTGGITADVAIRALDRAEHLVAEGGRIRDAT